MCTPRRAARALVAAPRPGQNLAELGILQILQRAALGPRARPVAACGKKFGAVRAGPAPVRTRKVGFLENLSNMGSWYRQFHPQIRGF